MEPFNRLAAVHLSSFEDFSSGLDGQTSPDGGIHSDSGVSTMKSISARDFNMRSVVQRNSFETILLSEHNNNYPDNIDVVKLLQLKSVDDTEQHSNSSSLESLNSLENHQGSQERDEADGGSGSTSCSEDSFEMSSTCSAREIDTSPEHSPLRKGYAIVSSQSHITKDSRETTCDLAYTIGAPSDIMESTLLGSSEGRERPSTFVVRPPPNSISMDSFMIKNSNIQAIRKSIDQELNSLDTGLPNLDFDKLEKQLATAAKEREDHERKLLGEEVRRRLALQVDFSCGPSPSVNTRPHRSNLAMRLQTAMNLQVCYINELAESSTESDASDSEDEGCMVPKSRSAPNLKDSCHPCSSFENLEALREKAKNIRLLDPYERRALLHEETKRVILKSKSSAQESLNLYRSKKSKASGVPRQARHYLSKMDMEEIKWIKNIMEDAINKKNIELVQLLIDRDSMHMEHDSLLVDIDDFTEHEIQATALDFPSLFAMQDGDITSSINNSESIKLASINASKTMFNEAPTPTNTPASPSKVAVNFAKSLTRFSIFKR